MGDTSAYLDGNCVFYDSFGEWVEYRSRSEALVASLVLHFKLPLKTLEPIFDLLCCGDEYRAAECSFSRPTDVYSRMTTLRTRNALERPGTTDTSNDQTIGFVAGFPNLDVFRGVIESLVEERRQIVHESHFPSYLTDEQARTEEVDEEDAWRATDTLERMSLVHRTWTIPAQQALRRCAIVKYKSHQSGSRSHPLIAASTSPCLAFADTFVFENEELLSEDEMILLKGIITYPYQRTLQNLHLELVLDSADRRSRSKAHRSSNSAAEGLDCIGTLESLKKLSLRFEVRRINDLDERNKFVESACFVITHLHCLQAFRMLGEVYTVDDASDFEVSSRLAHAHPPPSLKSLCIGLEHPQARILSWLTTPRAGYQLEHLTLFPSTREHDSELSTIRLSVPFLKSLSIYAPCYLSTGHNEEVENSGLLFKEIMHEALSAQTLVLRFTFPDRRIDFKMIMMSSLPPVLQRLSLLFFVCVSLKEADRNEYNLKLDKAISRFALSVNRKGGLRVIIDNRAWYVYTIHPITLRPSSRTR